MAEGAAQVVAAWTRGGLSTAGARPSREVQTGDGNVELALTSARDLDVRITGLQTEHPPRLVLHLVPLDPAGEIDDALEATLRDCTACFRGLEPRRRYLLWGRLVDLGWCVYAEVDAVATSVAASFQRGGTIRGRVFVPVDASNRTRVVLRGRFRIETELDADGRFIIRAVPDGDWRIDAWCEGDAALRSASVSARPGDEVEIDLRSP